MNLERPLSKDELDIVIKQMKPGKSPGPDGLTVGYYKAFTNVLYTPFLNAFNYLSTDKSPPRDLLTAHIAVLPKPDKDQTLISNYRPISLLNVDLKMYAKILANRLLPLLPHLVSLDQVGFVPGREARDNTLKALNIHKWLTSKKQDGFFLSLDAEKAFDRVAWDYLTEVLKQIGMRDRMLQFILALYSKPTARVRINGHLSDAFCVQWDTSRLPSFPTNFYPNIRTLSSTIERKPRYQKVYP